MKHETLVPVLAEALEAHGGVDRWRTFEQLSSTIVTGGALWGLKGVEMPPIPRRVATDLRRQRASFTPFIEPASTMVWTPERVVIQQASDIVGERFSPRESFAGHLLETPWDLLQLAYFQGYAMWTYHSLPFLLADPGFEVREIEPVEDRGEILRGVSARFPGEIHSHSRVQRFYFGADGLLRRHDYDVEISGGTSAAHYVSDYVEVDGFRFPGRREVFVRAADGSVSRDFFVVEVDLSDYRLR
ncbi:MAG TPA: hypothetical protein VF652_03310 [Allosphingosinicella sp.]|jgi:hypothetical protein